MWLFVKRLQRLKLSFFPSQMWSFFLFHLKVVHGLVKKKYSKWFLGFKRNQGAAGTFIFCLPLAFSYVDFAVSFLSGVFLLQGVGFCSDWGAWQDQVANPWDVPSKTAPLLASGAWSFCSLCLDVRIPEHLQSHHSLRMVRAPMSLGGR